MATHEERIKQLIVMNTGIDPEHITPEKNLVADLGFDSLDQIELVMAVEDEFAVEVEDDRAEKCQTVADVITLVAELAGEQQ
jgi:acyl carrier protein